MTNMPLVSIILPTHNRARTLRRSINSILAQSFSDFHLIVIDDASEDETTTVVESLCDGRISYLRSEDRIGAAAARNVGIGATKSELLAFQDSDDEWEPDKLKVQIAVLGSSNTAGVIYSDMWRISKDSRTELFIAPNITNSSLLDEDHRYSVQGIGIQSALIRRDLLSRVGLFDTSLPALEDLDFFIRLSKETRFIKVDTPLVRYYETEGISSNRLKLADARRRLLQKYASELQGHRKFVAKELLEIAGLERY